MSGHGMYNLTSTDGDTAKAALSQTINVKGAVYQYFIAAGTIVTNSLCTVQNDYDAEEATTTTSGAKPTLCCIPQFALADNEYFWAPIGPFFLREDGVTTFKVQAANCATSVKVYTTATDGVIDDDASGTDLIHGLYLTETVTTQEAADCQAASQIGTNLA